MYDCTMQGGEQKRLEQAAALVRSARLAAGESQRAFAKRMGSRQSLICKYERGEVSPPAPLLIQCMNLTGTPTSDVTPEQLARLVHLRLTGDKMAAARQAVADLIRCLQPSR